MRLRLLRCCDLWFSPGVVWLESYIILRVGKGTWLASGEPQRQVSACRGPGKQGQLEEDAGAGTSRLGTGCYGSVGRLGTAEQVRLATGGRVNYLTATGDLDCGWGRGEPLSHVELGPGKGRNRSPPGDRVLHFRGPNQPTKAVYIRRTRDPQCASLLPGFVQHDSNGLPHSLPGANAPVRG
jgi:hypothetical protein